MRKDYQLAALPLLSLCLCLSSQRVGAQSPAQPQSSAQMTAAQIAAAGIAINPGSLHREPAPNVLEAGRLCRAAITRGEDALKVGNADKAVRAFQEALGLEPNEVLALQRLAEGYTAQGNLDRAIDTYRFLLYDHPGKGWSSSCSSDPALLMRFALALLQTGQAEEALSVYHHALGFFNYRDGKPANKVLLPEFGSGPGQWAYTPQRLQAMAHVALAEESAHFDGKEELSNLQVAAGLDPDSGIPQFYIGMYLFAHGRHDQAKAALQQAIQMGGDKMAAAAQEYLKIMH